MKYITLQRTGCVTVRLFGELETHAHERCSMAVAEKQGETGMRTADIIKAQNIKITCTHGNASNGISGSRVTVWDRDGNIQDRFDVPKRYGVTYCLQYENGKYGRRFREAVEVVARY